MFRPLWKEDRRGKMWSGNSLFENVYEWAGKLRNANLAKGGFQFAAADRILGL